MSVVNKDQALIGIVTRTDLLQSVEVSAALPPEQRDHMMVKDIMVKDPIAISAEDTTMLAFATMRERGMKRLPVVESRRNRVVTGYVRIENIMDEAVQRFSGTERRKISKTPLTQEIGRQH
jgi:CBS domain-containing protein